jgi:ABC-type antimicrobial peptide transport system permease subunit
MAVGARSRDILVQFLIEATLLCLAGGVVGICMGRLTSYIVRQTLDWATAPSIPAIVISFAVSALVGVGFGFYPAWKASRLDPIDALRYE